MDNFIDLRKLRKRIKKIQDTKRFEHTLGVEFTAAALAMRYDVSISDAQTAGLLHDCAKCMSDEKKLNICRKNGIEVTDVEERNPYLLHAKVGAFLAKKKYGIENQDIINAIRNHTTGRENMSFLEKIIFIADYIEPGRKQAKNLSEIRKMAFEDIDHALITILQETVNYLKKSGKETDPLTEKTLQYYSKNNHN